MTEEIAHAWFLEGTKDCERMRIPALPQISVAKPPHNLALWAHSEGPVEVEPISTEEYIARHFITSGGDRVVVYLLEATEPDSVLILVDGLCWCFGSQSDLDRCVARVAQELPYEWTQNRERLCRRLAIIGQLYLRKISSLATQHGMLRR